MIYIDSDFRCYTEPAEGRTAIETDVFDGKCAAYIEGMRYVPEGGTWTREDGVVFAGEMIAPWRDSRDLDNIQREYERTQYAEAVAAVDALLLAVGGGTV